MNTHDTPRSHGSQRTDERSTTLRRMPFAVVLAVLVLAFASPAPAERVPGDCTPADLAVQLTTGWDQGTGGTVIPTGSPDDDWDVTVDASGGTVPSDATVINSHPAWLTFPNSKWISAAATGPNGLYVYEMCWCMDDDFSNPLLEFAIRADDQADVLLNGNPLMSLPDGTFNDPIAPGLSVNNPGFFNVGENCLEVRVQNKYGVVTGFNLAGTVTADDGLCCACDPRDLVDDASTGVNDDTGGLIATGADDDEWIVTGSASGGTLPRPADVISTFAGWNVIPGTKWITADETGPNGDYVYEKCWCMNDAFQDAQLNMELLADDRADVYLNGALIGSTPATNAFLFPATFISAPAALFKPGENCLRVEVENVSSVVTGMNASVEITATDATCCECTDLPPDAEAWWPLGETTGTTAVDIVSGHDGTHSELFATAPPPTPAPGYIGGALSFDGVDDWVDVPDESGLDFGAGQDFTIDAWINTTSDLRETIVQKKTPGIQPGYALYLGGGLIFFEISDGVTYGGCVGTTVLNDGDWHFVAVTVDRDLSSGIRLYADGVIDQICDPTSVSGSLSNSDSFFIGGDPLAGASGTTWWLGQLDEIEIFRRALTEFQIQELYLAGTAGKCPPVHCEEATGLPECEGTCPAGFVCGPGFPGGPPCFCEPEPEPCGETEPECNGACPIGQTCAEDAVGECECEDLVPPNCGNSPYPECNGVCDSGVTCQPLGPDFCDCPLPLPCEDASYPTCEAFCPPGEVCSPGPAGDCVCLPAPHCGDAGDWPACDLPCPDGFVCEQVPGADDCYCADEFPDCGDTFYPECNGDCPPGEKCKNILGTDECECGPVPAPCGDGLYPECNGDCPVDEKCVELESGIPGCECKPCADVGPSGPIVIAWPDKKDQLRWDPVQCALVYNVYRATGFRLRDLDNDGLADDYGSCYVGDIIGTDAPDRSEPPPRAMHWYLVTGENFTSETSLGENSARQERPNAAPCP